MIAAREGGVGEADPLLGAHFGRYHIEALLGEGGMARVYRARLRGPMGFERSVAIKRIRPADGGSASQRLVRSLVNEARLGGHLSHPNVVDVLEFGEADGDFFIVMELVDGPSLADVMRCCRERETALPMALALRVLTDVARGLAYAHELSDDDGVTVGLVHRDLKPDNILISASGQAMVTDFGLAKSDDNLYQSSTVEVKGTPAYMSPEQVASKPVTAASDLFSLGSILYEMLRGVPLFSADGVIQLAYQVARAELDEPRAWVRGHHPEVADLFDRLVARSPEDRPASAREVERIAAELLRVYPAEPGLEQLVAWTRDDEATADSLASAHVTLAPPSSPEPSRRGAPTPHATPRPWGRIALAGVLLVALAASVGWAMGWLQRDEQAMEQRRAAREARKAARRGLGTGEAQPTPAAAQVEEATPAPATAPEALTPAVEVDDGAAPGAGEPASTASHTASAQAAPSATLVVACVPWCDQVRVDGDPWGPTPIRDRSVTPGGHEVYLRAHTGEEQTLRVDVAPDGSKVCWDFQLEAACGAI